MNKKIYAVVGAAGAGKTQNILEWMQRFHNPQKNPDNNWIVSMPSVDMCNKLAAQHAWKTIHSGNHTSVYTAVIDWIKQHRTHSNQVLVICHETREMIDNADMHNYQLLVDDNTLKPEFIKLKGEEKHPVSNYWQPADSSNELCTQIMPTETLLYCMQHREDTVVCKDMLDLAQKAVSGKFQVHLTSKNDKHNNMYAVIIPQRDYYPDYTVVMGAHVLRDAWSALYADSIIECYRIQPPQTHSKQVTIHYFADGMLTRSRKDADPAAYQKIIKQINQEIGTQAKLVLKPRAENEDLYSITQEDSFLNTNCHGSNDYQNINNVVLTGVYNYETTYIKALSRLGYSPQQLYAIRTGETYYQTAMRSSLRNRHSSEQVNIYVIDQYSAEYLAELLRRDHGFDVRLCNKNMDLLLAKKAPGRPAAGLPVAVRNKIGKIVAQAQRGFYSQEENAKILMLNKQNKRCEVANLELFNQVSSNGLWLSKK